MLWRPGPEATTFDDDKDDIRGQRLSVTDWEEEFVDDPCDHLEGFLNEPEVVFEEHVWSGSEEDDEGANQGETEPMAHSEGVDTGRAIRQDVLLPSCSSEMKQDLSRGGDGPETPPLHPRTPPEDTPAPTTEIHNARPYDDFGFDDDDDDFGPYDEDSNDEYQNYIDDIIDAQQAYPYWHDAESEAGEAMDPEGSLPPLVYEDDTDEAGDHLSNDSAEGHSNNIWEGLDEGGTSNEEIQGQHWGGLPDPDENESNLSDEMPPYGGMDIFEQHGPGINQEAHFPEDMLEYEHQLDILQSFPFLAAQINWWRERQNRRTEPEPAPWVDWTYRDTCPFYIVDDHGVSTRRSCCEDEDSTVAELVLGATVNTLYLMDCPKGTDSLRILHSLPRVVASLDTRMDPMLAHFDRLCFLEWIPFLSCAMVASQKGSAAVVRILRTHSPERGESQFKMIVERVIPQLPPSAPLIGMFIDETRGKEFFERRREYRVNLLYGDSSMLTYSLQASRMINPLNGNVSPWLDAQILPH
ncbi:hypothetical protein DFS34DRAFT_197240 [Phlyctochytrium arcticum]|nr:hypothetical protein DFS34DRAFT_197240 [Phlyctochytrium arcticum]